MSRSFSLSVVAMIALVAVAACSAPGSTPSFPPASTAATGRASQAPPTATPPPVATPSPVASAAAAPVVFTSPRYGYTITLPAGWRAAEAFLTWDGASSPGHQDATADKFLSPSTTTAFAYAAPVSSDLETFAEDNNAWVVRDHGDTCLATAPETTEPIEIDGAPGMLMSWNCGILINFAVTVRDGIGFVMVMRDPGVVAATDPADRAILEELLASMILPS